MPFDGQVIKVGEPLAPPEPKPVWANCLNIRRITENNIDRYDVEFTLPSKAHDPFDDIVRQCISEAVSKL